MENKMSITEDRAAFMTGGDRIELEDGIIIELFDDGDGYLSAGEDDLEGTQYVGVGVRDPETGIEDSLWGTGVLPSQSGMEVRAMLWETVVADFHDLLGTVRAARSAELLESAEWAARDTMTVAS